MSEKLKPCPFCGSPAEEYPDGDMEGYSIHCSSPIGTCPTNTFGHKDRAVSIEQWNRRAPESASQPDGGEDAHLSEMLERFKIRMTPYGMLVRALRIVAGTTLMDMANQLGTSPARLSGMEVGRKPVSHDDVVAASGYFHGLGIPGTLIALECAHGACIAAPSAGNGGAN